MTARHRLFEILERSSRADAVSRLVGNALVVLIILNLAAIMLESVAELHADWAAEFYAFELISVAVFTVEYLLRVWCSIEDERYAARGAVLGRLRYMVSPMALVDLVAILPFYLGFLFVLDLRFMRSLRLLRIFKLTRYFSAIRVVLDVLREEAQAFGAAIFVLLVIMVLASSGIYLFEHKAQPEAFGSIPAAMWWAVATLTTVGYGDVTPITVGGKVFGACITVVGIGMVALPAGILASGFSDHLHTRKTSYSEEVDKMLRDGALSPEEERELEEMREELALSREDAAFIVAQTKKHRRRPFGVCPCCKRPFGRD